MNYKKETEKIVAFIKETFKEAGFKKAIIGISGGIDSAVVAYLLVEALGEENVYGVSLPYGTQADKEDANKIGNKLGINYDTINIKSSVDALKKTIKYDIEDVISEGNIKARTRMIILYDLSAFHNALVVGTGNKTELMLGYFTLYGDGACAMEPLGHLYKTEVKELAKYLKVPEEIINKPPSAGLWEGQTDEEELGYSYKEIDNCLVQINVYGEYPPYDVPKNGIYNTLLEKIKKNKFKSQLPKQIGERNG